MNKTTCKEKTSIYVIDQNYRIVYYNSALETIFPQLHSGLCCYEVLCHEKYPCKGCPLLGEKKGGSVFYNEWIQRWVSVNIAEINWPGTGVCHAVMATGIYGDNINLFYNLTNLSTYDELLEINLTEDTYKVLYHTNNKFDAPILQESFCKMIQILAEQMVHPDDQASYLDFWNFDNLILRLDGIISQEFLHSEFRKKRTDGSWCWMQQLIVPVQYSGNEDKIIMCFVNDIHEQKEREKFALYNINTVNSGEDVLTGLYCRSSFFKRAEELLRKFSENSYCLMAIDIEHFKLFNEWYGQAAGDAFLLKVASHLKRVQEVSGGVAGYLGDDDFAILLPNDKIQIRYLQKQIIDQVKQCGNNAGFLPAFGMYLVQDRFIPVATMYDRASIALAKVKGNYATRVCWFEPGMIHKMEEEHLLLSDVQRALERHEFIFFAQPQCDIATGKIVGAESLVRWNHKTKGLIPPGDFIPLLEKNGFIADLDRYVWEKVCQWLRSWIERGNKPIPISVNVSRVDIYSMDIAEYFRELATRYQLDPSYIEIEITESAYVEEYHIFTQIVEKLRSYGFPVLMDDFGSGYSSLNMLKDVNVDVLKIDMRFLDADEQSVKRGAGILEAVANMARLMGIRIIVEGVETQKQVEFLLGMGCNYAQGYYFYHPLPISEFEVLLADETNLDYRGIRTKNVEQLHIKELLNENLFSETMVNNILGAIAFFDVYEEQIEVIRVNEQYYNIVGDSSVGLAGQKNLLHYICQADHLVILNIFKQAHKNQFYGAEGDLRYIREDGSIIWLHLRSFFLREQDGHKLYYGSISDVTEQHKRAQMLESSQRALSIAISIAEEDSSFMQLTEHNRRVAASIFAQMAPSGMIGGYCEDGFPLYFANLEILKLLGYDSYEDFAKAIDYKVINTIHMEDRKRVAQDIGSRYYVGLAYTTTYRMLKKDGSWFWILDKGRVTEAEDGRLAIVSACMDISETMAAQQQLAERNAFLLRQNQELLFLNNDMPGGYHRCSKSPGFDFLHVSDRFLDIFGYTRDELKSLFDYKFINMIHPYDRQRVIDKVNLLGMNNESFIMEYRMLSKNGSIWVLDQSRYTEYNGQVFFQGIILDMTETIELRNKMDLLMEYIPEDMISLSWNKDKLVYKVLLHGLANKIGFTIDEYEKQLNNGFYQSRIAEGYYDALRTTIEQAVKNRQNYHTIFRFQALNKQFIWISMNLFYVGNVHADVHYLCICRDITAEKERVYEIQPLERKMESILRLAGVNSWDWDLVCDTLTLFNLTSDNQMLKIHKNMRQGKIMISNFSEVVSHGSYIVPGYENVLQLYVDKIYQGKEQERFAFESPMLTQDGDIVWFHFSCEVIYNTDKPIHVIGCYSDITAQKQQQQESQENMKVLELLCGQTMYDFKVNLVKNTFKTEKIEPQLEGETSQERSYTETAAYVAEQYILSEFKQSFRTFTDRERLLALFHEEKQMDRFDYKWLYRGTEQWARMTIHLTQLGGAGDIFAYIFIVDIDQQKRQELRLAQMAETDALTGLYNRHHAIPEIKTYLKTHPQEAAALAMFDLDNFKLANDIYGHAYGDAMISKIANEIKSNFGKDDIVCRIGGDEFLVLCKNIKQMEIENKLQEIVQCLTIAYSDHGQLSFFSVSAGYVMIPEQGQIFEDLFKKADTAMFAAKMNGKNSCRRFHPSMKTVRFELAEEKL